MSSTLFTCSRSAAHSFRTLPMSRNSKIRAADVGMCFWKKFRSRASMARFTGGRKRRDMAESSRRGGDDGGATTVFSIWSQTLNRKGVLLRRTCICTQCLIASRGVECEQLKRTFVMFEEMVGEKGAANWHWSPFTGKCNYGTVTIVNS